MNNNDSLGSKIISDLSLLNSEGRNEILGMLSDEKRQKFISKFKNLKNNILQDDVRFSNANLECTSRSIMLSNKCDDLEMNLSYILNGIKSGDSAASKNLFDFVRGFADEKQ